MAILSRPRFLPQQRLDLEDVNALLSALRTDSKFHVKQLLSSENLIFKGFSVSGIGLKSATVNMADATLVIPQNSNDFSWFTAAPAEPNIVIPDADLVDGVRNYVEILLTTENNTPLTKAFWDPESNSGAGSEFNQIVATMTDLKITMVVSTGGFSGSPDRLPVSIIDVDGSGNIKSIFDRRVLFGRLSKPTDLDNRFNWGSKVESAYSLILDGVSGTFTSGETISIGGETATVVTGGTTSITFNLPTGINFFPGDTVTGGSSGATGTINSVSESFTGVDKNLKTQKDVNDALMTEIASVKGTRLWYEDAGVSLSGITKSLESILVQATNTAKFSWDGANLQITDDNVSPSNDVLGYIRIMGRSVDLELTRQDGTGGTSLIPIADGQVLFVKTTALSNRTYSESGVADTNFQTIDIASYKSLDDTYWIGYREGTRLYIRGYGELEPGEDANIGDGLSNDLLAFIGSTGETDDSPNYTSENFVSDGDSLVTAISKIDNALKTIGPVKVLGGGTIDSALSSGGSPTLIDSTNWAPGSSGPISITNSTFRRARELTNTSGNFNLAQLEMKIRTVGAPTGNLIVKVYSDVGGLPGSVLDMSNTVNISSLTSSYTSVFFIFPSPVSILNGAVYHYSIEYSGATIDGSNYIQVDSETGVPPSAFASSYNGAVWSEVAGSPNLQSMQFYQSGIGTDVEVSFDADMYLEVKGLNYADNTIPTSESPIVFTSDLDVAYVTPNLITGGPNLTITVSTLDNVPLNSIVIARREGTDVIVGSSSTRLVVGESKKLYAGLSDQNSQFVGITDEASASPVYSSAFNISNGDSLVTAVGKLDIEVKNANDGIATKEPAIAATTSADYYRGDKTFQPLDNAAVGLGDVTDDAQLKRSANDFSTFAEKTTIVNDDLILIEDSEALGVKKYVKKSNLGSGSGDGIKNFIANGNADNASASIFTGYSDGGTRPTDGTGGISTGITTGVEVVGTIDGLKSYYIQKTTTANQQGFGQSIPFSIPKAYRADLLKISFDYILESGTFQAGTNALDSDLIVYIYDVTNSKLIEPSDIKLRSNSTSICDKYEATFPTSFDGSDYRLIFHQATTTTTVYKLIVDNIAISPQNLNYVGVALDNILLYQNSGNINNTGGVDSLVSLPNIVSNSGAYSVTSGGVVIQKTGKYKIRIKTEIGANSESVVLKIDINGTKTSGRSHSIDVNASGSQSLLEDSFYVDLIPGDLVRFYVLNPNTRPYQASELELTQLTSPSVARISDGYDGRVITGKATLSNSSFATTINVNTKVPFDTVGIDDVGGFSSGSYIVKSAGKYNFYGRLSTAITTAVGEIATYIYKNGVAVDVSANTKSGTAGQPASCHFNFLVDVKVGDIIDIYVFQNMTAGLILRGDNFAYGITSVNVTKISGPNTISASETVALRYTSTSGSVIQATPTTFLYGTKDYSTRGGYDPATGEFRPPLAGQYKIKASIYGNYSAAINDLQISFYVNGVLKSFNVKTTPNGSAQQVEHVDTLELITTDILTIRVHYAAPSVTFASSTAVGANVLTIERIK